ncbi:MAG: hypothetical protein QM642_03650 [Edaphocola sp.]
MKKVRVFLLLATMAVATGCVKESYTITEAWLYNATADTITIFAYIGGEVSGSDTIKIAPDDSFQFANSTLQQDLTAPYFKSPFIGDSADYLLVVFDSTAQMAHYDVVVDSSIKYYPVTSTRNLRNFGSYEFGMQDFEEKIHINYHRYTFTEQDYEDAKQ